MKKILLIVHQASSDPGLIGQVLHDHGCLLDIRRPCLGEILPETMDEHDGTVVFGGPMSANDDNTLPFIRTELDWISIAIASDKPYLGICLGAQLLARVLGAIVAPHADKLTEIGYHPITPTIDGRGFPLTVYQWHREGFELPQGATLLAKGNLFPNQAFCYGAAAAGLQFHPEITAHLIDRWITHAAEHPDRPEFQPRELHLQQHQLYGAIVENWLRKFLHDWLHSALLSDREVCSLYANTSI